MNHVHVIDEVTIDKKHISFSKPKHANSKKAMVPMQHPIPYTKAPLIYIV
jgi:hypothetical protein